jgi:hypothetical protein
MCKQILAVLDRPIAFHRPFVKLAGSVTAALMLSQALYWQKRTPDQDGWFYKTQAEWEDETGLTRSEQETARKRLAQITSITGAPIWQEDRRGVPAKMFFRLDIDALADCLQSSLQETSAPVCGNPAIKNAEILQSGTQETSNQDSVNPADKIAETPQTFVLESTSETTTETTAKRGRKKAPAAQAPAPTPQTNMFGKICEVVGWDHHTLSEKDKGQIIQTVGILSKAGYTPADLDRFWDQVWKFDWRWMDRHSRPSIAQLRQEIGKLRNTIDLPPKDKQPDYTNGRRQMSKVEASMAAVDRVFARLEAEGGLDGNEE